MISAILTETSNNSLCPVSLVIFGSFLSSISHVDHHFYTRGDRSPLLYLYLQMLFVSSASTLSTEPISVNICMTRSFAPPCNGPFNDDTAAVTPEYISDNDDTAQRAVKADAFNS